MEHELPEELVAIDPPFFGFALRIFDLDPEVGPFKSACVFDIPLVAFDPLLLPEGANAVAFFEGSRLAPEPRPGAMDRLGCLKQQYRSRGLDALNCWYPGT